MSYAVDGLAYQRESFISHPDQVMVVRLTASEPGRINFEAELSSKLRYTVRAGTDHLVLTGKAPAHVAHRDDDPKGIVVYDSEGAGMPFEAQLRLFPKGGEIRSQGGAIQVSGADEVLLVLATATGFNGYDRSPTREGKDPAVVAEGIFDAITDFSWETLYRRHIEDHSELFDRVELDLGPVPDQPTDERLRRYDPGHDDQDLLALYFQYGRYLLIASSRPGTPPANLQGIWNHRVRPAWGSNYTMNINTQMNFWLAEVTQLPELHHSLFDLIDALAVNGAETARVNYGIESGWLAHHNSDVWAKTAPTGGGDWDERGSPRWSAWPMAGAWLTRHLWEHYLHTGDREFLANRAWPRMRGSAEFLMNWMVEDADGRLVTNPSTSPENAFRHVDGVSAISMASTMDMSIVRESFSDFLRASAILDKEDEFVQSVSAAVPRLFPFQIGRLGQLQEWYCDWDRYEDKHRHISHLFSLYPGSQISPEFSPTSQGPACEPSSTAAM